MPLDSGKPPRRRIEGAQDPARLLVRVCHEPQLHLRDPGVDRILGHDAIVGWYVHGHGYSHARTHTRTHANLLPPDISRASGSIERQRQ